MDADIQTDLCENCSEKVNSTLSFGPFRCGIPPSLPPDIPPVVDHIQATIVMVMLVLSLVLNGFVVFLVARYRVLQHRGFFLALQLVVANLVSNSVVRLVTFTNCIARRWLYGDIMCELFGILQYGLAAVRFLLMLVLALDRTFTVFLPFHYAKHGNKISTVMSLAAWSVSFVRVLIPLRGVMNCYAYLPAFKICTAVSCSSTCQIYTLSMLGVLGALGCLVPFLLYILLFCKAKKLKRQLRLTPVTTPGGIRAPTDVFRSQQNRRTLVTFLILSIALVGSVLPPFILYAIQFAFPGKPPSVLLVLQILLGRTFFYALSVADPIVILRNSDVKEVTARLKASILQKIHCNPLVKSSNGVSSCPPSQFHE